MVNAAGGDEMAARKMFCGLEAEVTTPDGRTATLVVGESPAAGNPSPPPGTFVSVISVAFLVSVSLTVFARFRP